eukprot:819266-Rhodomonas_salina.3
MLPTPISLRPSPYAYLSTSISLPLRPHAPLLCAVCGARYRKRYAMWGTETECGTIRGTALLCAATTHLFSLVPLATPLHASYALSATRIPLSYSFATRCPVLLCGVWYWCAVVLCARYAMPGTDVGYGSRRYPVLAYSGPTHP